jgi:hypothetical protein
MKQTAGKMFPEMLVDFQQAAQHYIPEERTLPNHFCEKLTSYIIDI